MKFYVVCNKCNKTLRIKNEKESIQEQALANNWVSITIEHKDGLEAFFVCSKCYYKLGLL